MSAPMTSRSDGTPRAIRTYAPSRSESPPPQACGSIALSIWPQTVTTVSPRGRIARLSSPAPRKACMGRAERWVFAPESARRLAGVRIALCLLLAYRLTARDYDAFAARHVHFLPHFYMDLFAHM